MSARTECEDICAVVVKNVTFSYNKKTTVLNNLSLQIEKGKIFALLGSNGCGKTTLLKLILGRAKPKCGTVKVFGQEPGHKNPYIPGPAVGYMPQQIALVPEFTIEENMKYFSKLFHIKSEEFVERFQYLTQLLNLSQKFRRIDELSGGQQRLVSMAVAVLHRPTLIILDEPTVGVDPILRSRIWSYLNKICTEYRNTVIITTHYIEEAKRASNVGFMKSGAILKQSNPQTLMNECQCKTLEEVYLNLWKQDNLRLKDKKHEVNGNVSIPRSGISDIPKSESNENSNLYESKKFIVIPRVMGLIWKFNLRVKKFPIMLVCFLSIPFFAFFSLYMAVGHSPHNIPMAIYAEEPADFWTEQLIDSIDRKLLDVIHYETQDLAIDSIYKGRTAFAISIGQNFTDQFESRLITHNKKRVKNGNNCLITLYMDPSQSITLIYGFQYLVQLFLQFVTNVSISLGLNPKVFDLPITIEEPIYGIHPITGENTEKFRVNYDYLAPAILLIAFHLISMAFSAFSFILYRKDSQLERFFVTGGQPFEVIASHYISNVTFSSIQVFLLLFCTSYLFDIRQEGSYAEVYVICFLQSLQGTAFGLLAAIIFEQELSIGVFIASMVFPMYLTCGMFWPIEGIPSYFRWFADWTPLSKPIDSLRSVMLRGWDYSHPNVLIGYAVSLSYTLILFVSSAVLFQFYQEPIF